MQFFDRHRVPFAVGVDVGAGEGGAAAPGEVVAAGEDPVVAAFVPEKLRHIVKQAGDLPGAGFRREGGFTEPVKPGLPLFNRLHLPRHIGGEEDVADRQPLFAVPGSQAPDPAAPFRQAGKVPAEGKVCFFRQNRRVEEEGGAGAEDAAFFGHQVEVGAGTVALRLHPGGDAVADDRLAHGVPEGTVEFPVDKAHLRPAFAGFYGDFTRLIRERGRLHRAEGDIHDGQDPGGEVLACFDRTVGFEGQVEGGDGPGGLVPLGPDLDRKLHNYTSWA